jgi:hypothetical protein
MGINHRGFDILVAEQFLDGADVGVVLQEVSGEGMAKGVTTIMCLVILAAQVACLTAFCRLLSWR